MPVARYDGLAAWYDEFASPSAAASEAALRDLLADAPPGPVLDLGCGTGAYAGVLGPEVVGVDLSRSQLAVAATREPVAAADAAALPLRTGSFGLVAALWVTTDVDDLGAVLREAHRVLRPDDGRLVVFGVHPCFNGPCVEGAEDGSRRIHPTYRQAGWHEVSPWWGEAGIRRRVGMRHVPLAELLNAVVDAGFRLVRAVEPRDDPIPAVLALVATAA